MSEKQTNQNTFVSHLSELRSRLVKSFIFLIISFIICYFFSEEIYRFLVSNLIANKLIILRKNYF